ncbi:hypothetical protein CDAR_477701 [Caerostris darwini]|uniref:Uncharacterized protein n=1 Tax=Caerostris darwini TaxID=1538125 RepID=A0AAV4MF09_9ARAC|nr:hypothetical protein CDAR_477701 [Caerostris darwini]
MMKKFLAATSATDRNRSNTAFLSVSAYLTMMKNIIVSHFWHGQEQGPYSVSLCERLSYNDEKIIVNHFWCSQEQEPYSVSICERISNNDEKHYCQPFLVRTGTGALQRFHL